MNQAMEGCIQALKTFAKEKNMRPKIAVVEFNSNCRWVTPNGSVDLEGDFAYEPLKALGRANLGAALRELNSKLSRDAFLGSMTEALMPIIIFMTGGHSTDGYAKALEEIRMKRWFARGMKIGFDIGDDPDVNDTSVVKMITEVVGSIEAVLKVTDLELFGRLLSHHIMMNLEVDWVDDCDGEW